MHMHMGKCQPISFCEIRFMCDAISLICGNIRVSTSHASGRCGKIRAEICSSLIRTNYMVINLIIIIGIFSDVIITNRGNGKCVNDTE